VKELDPITKAAVDAAAKEIAVLPPARWRGWIVYLLELLALEDDLPEDAYSQVLTDLRASIDGRLAHGAW